jgi:predicted RNA-binding protein associated with RNAse of E/G family
VTFAAGGAGLLEPGREVTVALLHEGEVPRLSYPATVLSDDGAHVVVRARWAGDSDRDVGYALFEQGDVWTEHYWRDRWYAVKEIRHSSGALKGWYCDVTRPAAVDDRVLRSEDLYLDLFVSADRATVLRLDEDEFLASGLPERDPATAESARAALDELERHARAGLPGILR